MSGFSRTWSRRCFLQTTAAACGCVFVEAGLQARLVSAHQLSPRITTVDVGGATLFEGAGCNVIALPGPDGALMIDGGLAANAEALLYMAGVLTSSGRPADALPYFERSIKANPTTMALNGMGITLLALGERQRAVDAFRQSLRLDPKQPEVAQQLSQLR